MKTYLIALALFISQFLTINSMQAQVSVEWVHSYQTGTVAYGAIASAIDQQDNVYYLINYKDTLKRQILFNQDSIFSTDVQMRLMKTTPFGQVIWSKAWQNAQGSFLEIDNSGNILLAGDFDGTTDFDPNTGSFLVRSDTVGSSAEFLLKLDSNANFNWVNAIGGFALQGRSLTTGINNEIIWAGMFYGSVDFDPTSATNVVTGNFFDMYLQKFDSNGVVQFTYTYVSNPSNLANGLAVNSKGDLYMVGICNNIDFDPSSGSSPMQSNANFLVKYDSNGVYQWVQYWDVTPTDIKIDRQNDDLYIGGNFTGSQDFDPGSGVQNNTSAGGRDAFAMRLDSNAQFVWARTIGGSGNDEVQAMDYLNPYLTLGISFEGTVNIFNSSTPTTHNSLGATDLLTVSLDSNGLIDLSDSYGSSGIDAFQSIRIQSDQTYYFSGTYESNINFSPSSSLNAGTPYNRSNFFIAKANRFTVGLETTTSEKALVNIYPNPSKGQLQIETTEQTDLIVFNGLGQQVADHKLIKGKQTLNFDELPKGVYYFQFVSPTAEKSVQKVILLD